MYVFIKKQNWKMLPNYRDLVSHKEKEKKETYIKR